MARRVSTLQRHLATHPLPDTADKDGLLEYSVVYSDRGLNHMSKEFQVSAYLFWHFVRVKKPFFKSFFFCWPLGAEVGDVQTDYCTAISPTPILPHPTRSLFLLLPSATRPNTPCKLCSTAFGRVNQKDETQRTEWTFFGKTLGLHPRPHSI